MRLNVTAIWAAGLLAAASIPQALASDRSVCDSDKSTPDQTIKACSRLIARNANDATSYYNRGIGYKNLKDYARAISDYTTAIGIKPTYAEAFNNRCAAYNKINKYDLAIKDCTEALRLRPAYENAFAGRAIAYEGKGQVDDAIEDYRSALSVAPNYKLARDALERLGANKPDKRPAKLQVPEDVVPSPDGSTPAAAAAAAQ